MVWRSESELKVKMEVKTTIVGKWHDVQVPNNVDKYTYDSW